MKKKTLRAAGRCLMCLTLAVMAAALCLSVWKTERAAAEEAPAAAQISGLSDWTANGQAVPAETDGSLVLRPGAAYRKTERVDIQNNGLTLRFAVEGSFRRQDIWFALLLQSDYGEAVGDYKGINYLFKPVSTEAVASGQLDAIQSAYVRGIKEGGDTPKYVSAIKCTEIAEREMPYTFNLSLFYVDGTLVVNYGLDTFTTKMDLAGADLTALAASVVFGGEAAATSAISVRLKGFGPAKQGGIFTHAVDAAETDGKVTLTEASKRQGKMMVPVALSGKKDISLRFKLETVPGYHQDAQSVDSWLGIFLTETPNSALPGSCSAGMIVTMYENQSAETAHIGRQYFKNGTFLSNENGVNTERGKTFGVTISFEEGAVVFTLRGAASAEYRIPLDGQTFSSGIAYLSFAFHDSQKASLIEYNDLGEEIGRAPNPDVRYWSVSMEPIAQLGTPEVLSNGKKLNVKGGRTARITARMYGSSFSELQMKNGEAYQKVSVADYALAVGGDTLVINLTEDFARRILGEQVSFRLLSDHTEERYRNAATDFTVTVVEADEAVLTGSAAREFDLAAPDDVKLCFALGDDALLQVDGAGIGRNDYFYNPKTGNLYLKREFLKGLPVGEHSITVRFDFTDVAIRLKVVDTPAPVTGEKPNVGLIVGLSVGGALVLSGGAAAAVLLCKRGRKKRA